MEARRERKELEREVNQFVFAVAVRYLHDSDAEVGTVPTILRLFRAPPDPPQRLSAWDEAFLASLYGVDQASVVEQPMMKRQMVSSLVLAPAH